MYRYYLIKFEVEINYADGTYNSEYFDDEENAREYANECIEKGENNKNIVVYCKITTKDLSGGILRPIKHICEWEIKTAYVPTENMTIIIAEYYEYRKYKSTEIVGFYYGGESMENTIKYYGKLKAEY